MAGRSLLRCHISSGAALVARSLWVDLARSRIEILINTRLQPGDWSAWEEGETVKTVSDLNVAQFTWLKPGVNETDSSKGILLKRLNHFSCKAPLQRPFVNCNHLQPPAVLRVKLFAVPR